MAGWDALPADLRARIQRQRAGLLALSQSYAGRMESYAKQNAPWTDRTGNARNNLSGRAVIFDQDPDHYVVGVRLAHGMSYGVWLEVTNRPRGSAARPIIHPTIELFRDRFYDDCHKVVH
jgi:hypothetical protein